MNKQMKITLKALCFVIPGILTVLFFKFINEGFETSCEKESAVIEITSVQHRTAYVLLEDGTEMSVNQPHNLTVGDKYCVIIKHSNFVKDTTTYAIGHGVMDISKEKLNKEVIKLQNKETK